MARFPFPGWQAQVDGAPAPILTVDHALRGVYLPAGAHIPSRNGRQITLLDLATQVSGLPRMPSNFAPRDSTNPYADEGLGMFIERFLDAGFAESDVRQMVQANPKQLLGAQ